MSDPSQEPTTQPQPKRRYRTTNWAAYNRSLRSRGNLSIWLDPAMQWQALGSGKPGRPQQFSDASIQFCLTLKCLFGLALAGSGLQHHLPQASPA